MKRYFIPILILSFSSQLLAQSYTKLADSALRTMWAAKDTAGLRKSLNLYEEAFKLYPQDISSLGLYKSAVLAGELKEYDKAFGYLAHLLSLNNQSDQTWRTITGKYASSEYKNLLTDKRWLAIATKAQKLRNEFFDDLNRKQTEFQQASLQNLKPVLAKNGKTAYLLIKEFNNFKPKAERNYSIKFKVKDSLYTSYFVNLPVNYDPKKSYPVLFFLHGAVQSNALADFQGIDILGDWNRYYTKYAALNQVVMVYPKGSKQYNWMAPDDGFFMIPTMLKELKQAINIDDNKVFITGHSNGATGSFSYLMKQQSPFAGFYGFNTQPIVRLGGTFIRNIANRSYFNVSTNEDYYFPPGANDTLNMIMKELKADYQDHRYNGFPHWFPQFDESEQVYPLIFKDIKTRKRNPFHPEIYWECDDVKYGKADWLEVNELDTISKPANWHRTLNFNIHQLLSYDKKNNLVAKDTLLKAFKFPRKSGAIKGNFKNNEFHFETSAIKTFTVFISPEMVNMNLPVKIYVNGVKKVEKQPVYDKEWINANFEATFDRKAVWVDKIRVKL